MATDKDLVERLDSIYIVPGYKDLVVAKSANNKIQAIGTDNKGRRQYIYNHKYTKKRNDRKYDDIFELGKHIVQIEKDNVAMLNLLKNKDFKTWKLPEDYIPIIIYMLKTYHFRIGNEIYAKDNNSYGITTLKKEHITFSPKDNKFTIQFIGKKGILNKFSDDNSLMSKLLKLLIKNADSYKKSDGFIFRYYSNNNSGESVSHLITPDDIQLFFKNKYKSFITPKMFRTWYGNYHMLEHLRNLFNKKELKPRMTKGEVNQIISNCTEYVSSKLNNTPNVSKKSYIDNKILDLVIKNPYRFANLIPDNGEAQHHYLHKIIMSLRKK